MRRIILDTETTGLDPNQGHRITEIGALEMIDRKLSGRSFHTYLNPEREVDEGAYRITGLNLVFLQDKPKFCDIATELLTFIEGAQLVIHNAAFDIGFLDMELKPIREAYSIRAHHSVLDTWHLAKQLHPGQKNSLDALCRRYSVNNSNRELHGALIDAELLAKVYLAMTAGQTAFSLDAPPETNDPVSQTERAQSSPFHVHMASPAEQQQHQALVAWIEAQSQGQCLYKQIETES